VIQTSTQNLRRVAEKNHIEQDVVAHRIETMRCEPGFARLRRPNRLFTNAPSWCLWVVHHACVKSRRRFPDSAMAFLLCLAVEKVENGTTRTISRKA
jgi:hypothetical protein